jgi:TrmH family RNA methyltransferase
LLLLYNERLQGNEQRDRIEVVLVSPRNPLNIGAAARATANFGFERLTVVSPYEPHWREAKSAVGAEDLLQNAKRAERIAEAVSECTLVVGTGTLERRRPEQRVVRLPELAPLVGEELESGGRVALLFGPEKRGLTREDFSFCHLMVEIPTDARQPSMNLGQAVAVCLYELSARLTTGAPEPVKSDTARRADSAQLELLAGVIEEAMAVSNYSPGEMSVANRHDLRLLLRRLTLDERDARRIVGLFRRILWRLRR